MDTRKAEAKNYFLEAYRPILEPMGYFVKGRNFYRVDIENYFIISVAFCARAAGHDFEIGVTLYKFPNGIETLRIADRIQEANYYLSNLYHLRYRNKDWQNTWIDFNMEFTQRIDQSTKYFRELVLPLLEPIHTLEDCFEQENKWQLSFFKQYLDFEDKVYVGLWLNRYEEAADYLKLLIEQWEIRIERRNASWIRSDQRRGPSKKEEEGIQKCRELLTRIENHDTAYFNKRLEDNVKRSIADCKEYFKRYQKYF